MYGACRGNCGAERGNNRSFGHANLYVLDAGPRRNTKLAVPDLRPRAGPPFCAYPTPSHCFFGNSARGIWRRLYRPVSIQSTVCEVPLPAIGIDFSVMKTTRMTQGHRAKRCNLKYGAHIFSFRPRRCSRGGGCLRPSPRRRPTAAGDYPPTPCVAGA